MDILHILDDRRFSRRELLGGMQMINWAVSQMLIHATRRTGRDSRSNREERVRARELFDLLRSKGQHWFHDHIAGLAPAHAEGEALGLHAARITNYQRSHDLVWTGCFINACCQLTPEGFELVPDWRERSRTIWLNIAKEIEAEIYPDFEHRNG